MSLLRKAALVNSSAFIGILFGVLQTVIVTRVLGPEGVGRYSLMVAALMLTTQLFSLGLPLSYLYYSQRDTPNTRKYLMNVFWLVLFSGIVGGLVLSCMIYFKRGYFGVYPLWIFLLIIIYIPVVIQSAVARNDLMIRIEARRLSLMNLATQGASVLFVLLFYLIGILTVNQAIVCFCLMSVVRLVMGLSWMRSKVSFDILPDWATAKDLLLMGIRQSWADLAVLVNGNISLLVIRYILDDFEQVGYFSRGQRIALLIVTAGQAVLPMLFSRWAAISAEKLPEHVERVLRFCFAMVLCMAVGLLIFGKWILLILYGREFLPALAPLLVLMPGTGLYLVSRALMQLFGSRGRPEVSAGILLFTSALTVVLSFTLTPIWSITGAAVAQLIGNVVLLFLLLATVKKIFNVRLEKSLLINSQDIKIIYKQLISRRKNSV
ncbi:MAG: oligosaccharide flippase family protein [Nitrospinales bacterium]